MKSIAILMAAVAATRLQHKFVGDIDAYDHENLSELRTSIYGKAKDDTAQTLYPHVKQAWPHGRLDDGTDDDKVLNYVAPPAEPAPAVTSGFSNQRETRPAIPGQWPIG